MKKLPGIVLVIFGMACIAAAAPYEGKGFVFTQPDGSKVPVQVYGDEWYQDVKTPQGALLVRDDSGWICFAAVSSAGDRLISTGQRYVPGGAVSLFPAYGLPATGISGNARIRLAAQKRMQRLGSMSYERPEVLRPLPAPQASFAAAGVPDTIWGLTVLADFADEPAEIPRAELDDLLNKTGYTGYGNNGSVKDYYYEVSAGHLVYVNRVAAYVRASRNKSYYDNAGGDPQAFMQDVLGSLKASGFDFSFLTVGSSGRAVSVNVLYAGVPEAGWANGLWPHQGTLQNTFNCGGGVYLSRYEMTDISSSPSIGTLCHENGHMLFGWQDLYAYDQATNGAGRFCVMSTSSDVNPMYPNPYYRTLEGWVDPVDIAEEPTGSVFSIRTDDAFTYRYARGTAGVDGEAFYVDVKARSGRNSGLPDAGLCIWHVDPKGSNTSGGGIGRDYVNIEQADGRNDLERKSNSGDAGDLFDAGSRSAFGDNSSPNASWHDGSASGLDMRNISEKADEMSFSIGEASMTPSIKLTSPNGGDTVSIGDSIEIRWQDNIAGMVTIELVNAGISASITLAASTESDGRFGWRIPAGTATGSGWRFRISAVGNEQLFDESDTACVIAPKLPRLTVVNGTGSGRYPGGTIVTVRADTAERGQEFAGWSGDVASMSDAGFAVATIAMPPEEDLSITATYRAIPPDGILMPPGRGNTVVIESDTLFYDDAGTFSDYSKTFDGDITLMPGRPGASIILEFLSFDIEDTSDGRAWDTLFIYDGVDSTAELLGVFWGSHSPGKIESRSQTGELTVRFKSDEGLEGAGWKARISLSSTTPVQSLSLPMTYGFRAQGSSVFFSVPASGAGNPAEFALVNGLGRTVGHWRFDALAAGWHQLDLAASGRGSLGSGMYILSMQAGDWSSSRRIVLNH